MNLLEVIRLLLQFLKVLHVLLHIAFVLLVQLHGVLVLLSSLEHVHEFYLCLALLDELLVAMGLEQAFPDGFEVLLFLL